MADEVWAQTHSAPLTLFPFSQCRIFVKSVFSVYPIMTRQIPSQLSQVVYPATFCFLLCLCCLVCFVDFVLCILSMIQIHTFWANCRTALSYSHASLSCIVPRGLPLGRTFLLHTFLLQPGPVAVGTQGRCPPGTDLHILPHTDSPILCISFFFILCLPSHFSGLNRLAAS